MQKVLNYYLNKIYMYKSIESDIYLKKKIEK